MARTDSSWDPTLGDELQPASRVLTLNVSRISDFQRCRRLFFNRWVLRLVGEASTETDAAWIGSATHAALNALHAKGRITQHGSHWHTNNATPVHSCGDEDPNPGAAAGPNLRNTAAEISHDPRVTALIRTHTMLCPGDSAEYIDGEVEARWLIARKSILITGRFDALWRYPDGTLEVRDYKTGRCPDSIDADLGAAIYLLLAANLALSQVPPNQPHTPVRVVYEGLAAPEGKLVSVAASRSRLRDALNEVLNLADHIRREKSFPASPSPTNCRICDYRHSCPYSLATEDD